MSKPADQPPPSDMEVDATAAEEKPLVRFSINVLELMREAQMQHGLRHGDYTRYRRYCTARLRRLYKSLKFLHGRGKYTRRNISESTVTDVRFLHIVFYMAERAWSHAMEKKTAGPNAQQRIYMLGRFRKAVKWAMLFSNLCSLKGDSRTSLEAEAYASYMKGTLLFEQEKNIEAAMTNFKNTSSARDKNKEENSFIQEYELKSLAFRAERCFYLAKSYSSAGKRAEAYTLFCHARSITDSALQQLAKSTDKALVQDLKALSDSCRSNSCIEHATGIMEEESVPEKLSKGVSTLSLGDEKRKAVLSETRSQQAASMTEFSWLGRRFPIANAKTRVSILKAQQLEKDLNGGNTESVPADKKLAIFDKIFSAYHDARSCIRNDLASAGNTENIRDELNGLDKAVSAVLGFRTIERNQLLVSIAKSKFTKNQDEKNEKITKPEELVRLYDLLIQEAFLLDMLESYESALGESNTKTPCRIARFPPPFQSVPCNPIVLDMAYNAIEFPNIENRMKKEKKGLLSRFWG
uniref:Signal recognition particle subunit SRP68 n=1 Tax=Leersia perrieri TaxID=77586 RepID=A0A0D9VSS3_9ORYZ